MNRSEPDGRSIAVGLRSQMEAEMYTVLDDHARIEVRDVDLVKAASTVLLHGGGRFEIRPDEGGRGFRLWTPTPFHSIETDQAAAERDIFEQVVHHASRWGNQEVVPEADYQRAMDNLE